MGKLTAWEKQSNVDRGVWKKKARDMHLLSMRAGLNPRVLPISLKSYTLKA